MRERRDGADYGIAATPLLGTALWKGRRRRLLWRMWLLFAAELELARSATASSSTQAGVADYWHGEKESVRKISVVSALLPPRGHGPEVGERGLGARLRVEASGGCYTWESQRPDLIRIELPDMYEAPSDALECLERRAQECMDGRNFRRHLYHIGEPVDRNCQPVAILRSLAREVDGVEKVLVHAKDLKDPDVKLLCEVYIANVARLEVETQVRHIKVGEVGKLSARAFDAEGNIFTSLEGLEFEWQVANPRVLQTLPAVDTALKLSPTRQRLAQEGVQPDTLLARGVATGRSSIGVHLPWAASKERTLVDMLVSEHIEILPAVLRLPLHSSWPLRLTAHRGKDTRGGHLIEMVALPSPNFQWLWEPMGLTSSGTVSVHEATGHLIALSEGVARVVAQDKRIENNSASALVYVSHPAVMEVATSALTSRVQADDQWRQIVRSVADAESKLHTLPRGPQTWQFVKGRKYAVILEARDASAQLLHLPPNFRVDFSSVPAAAPGSSLSPGHLAPNPLSILSRSANSALLLVEAVAVGYGELSFENATIVDESDKQAAVPIARRWPGHLQVKHRIQVVEPITLDAPFTGPVVLPPEHAYQLHPSGGSGTYGFALLSSDPPGLCRVSSSGLLQASAGDVGSAQVLISDAENVANNLTVEVLVLNLAGPLMQPTARHVPLSRGDDEGPFRVPVFGSPILPAGRRGGGEGQPGLRFWNCSLLLSPTAGKAKFELYAQSSKEGIAEVEVEENIDNAAGVCGLVIVTPRAAGEFEVLASAHLPSGDVDTDEDAEHPSDAAHVAGQEPDRLLMQVFEDVEVTFTSMHPLEGVLVEPVDHGAPLHLELAVCAGVFLHFRKGPSAVDGETRTEVKISSALQDTHLRIQAVEQETFEVVCLRSMDKEVKLVAELHLRNAKYGEQATVSSSTDIWIRCGEVDHFKIIPVSISDAGIHAIRTDIQPDSSIETKKGQHTLALTVGHLQHFWIGHHALDRRPLVHPADYKPTWSMELPEQSSWLSVDSDGVASIKVPDHIPVGTEVLLRAKAATPTREQCVELRSLGAAHAAELRGHELGRGPLENKLLLRAATNFSVRWPGYPSQHLPLAPDCAYQIVVMNASESMRLSLVDPEIAEFIDGSQLCNGSQESECLRSIGEAAGSAAGAARREPEGTRSEWSVHPRMAGGVEVVLDDVGTLGSSMWRREFTFQPVARLEIALADSPTTHGAPVLLLRGKKQPLKVSVWDVAGNSLAPALWQALHLEVETGSKLLSVEKDASTGSLALLGRAAGVFDVQAHARSVPAATLFSNALRVHVLEPLRLSPHHVAVIPGQTFELVLEGGAAEAQASTASISFSSADEDIASVTEDGLVRAKAPGNTTIKAIVSEVSSNRVLEEAFADVRVLLPAAAHIHPVSPAVVSQAGEIETGGATGRAPPPETIFLTPGAAVPVRLMAALTAEDPRHEGLTPSLLGAPRRVASLAGSEPPSGCTCSWSASDPRLALSPAVGGIAVDVLMPLDEGPSTSTMDTPEDMSATVLVDVSCPGVEPLHSSQKIDIRLPIRLVAPPLPAPLHRSCSSNAGSIALHLPAYARVPLAFNRAHEHLQVQLLDVGLAGSTATAGSPVVKLVDDDSGIQLQTTEPGDALGIVRDLRYDSPSLSPLALMIVVSRPASLRLLPSLQTLVEGATAEMVVTLASSEGVPLVFPSNYDVSVDVSHQSVVSAHALRHLDDGRMVVKLQGRSEGCAAVTVVASPTSSRDSLQDVLKVADIVQICVKPNRLAKLQPLILHPGARLHFPRRDFVFHGSAATFSLRLPCSLFSAKLPLLAQQIAEAVAKCGINGMVDVDLRKIEDSGRMGGGRTWMGLHEIDESWLECADLGHGVRGASLVANEQDADEKQLSCGEVPEGWSSSSSGIIRLDKSGEGEAVAPGPATVSVCMRSVLYTFPVLVEPVALIRVGAPIDTGIIVHNGTVSNHAGRMVLPLQFFSRQSPLVELTSGPFHAQVFDATCALTSGSLAAYYHISTVRLDNASAWHMAGEDEDHMPTLGCIIEPMPAPETSKSLPPPPAQLEVEVMMVAAPWHRPVLEGPRQWSFVPRFLVMAQDGEVLRAGDRIARLRQDRPRAWVDVWTGGHALEAISLAAGALNGTLQVTTGAAGGLSSMTVPVALSWAPPVHFPTSVEVMVRLESPASGQTEVFKVLLEGDEPLRETGSVREEVREVVATSDSNDNLVWLLLALLLALISGICGYAVQLKSQPRQQQPAHAMPVHLGGRSPFRAVGPG